MSYYNSKHTKTVKNFKKKKKKGQPKKTLPNYSSLHEAHNGYMMSPGAEIQQNFIAE